MIVAWFALEVNADLWVRTALFSELISNFQVDIVIQQRNKDRL